MELNAPQDVVPSQWWLVVERYENWLVDRDRKFATLGFPERMKRRVSSLKAGDRLVIYVSSGCSAITGVREVLSSETRYRPDFSYLDLFPGKGRERDRKLQRPSDSTRPPPERSIERRLSPWQLVTPTRSPVPRRPRPQN